MSRKLEGKTALITGGSRGMFPHLSSSDCGLLVRTCSLG